MDQLVDDLIARPEDGPDPARRIAGSNAYASGAERRAHVRWNSGGVKATIRIGETDLPCRLRDISAGGAGLYPDFSTRAGTMAVLIVSERVSLPGKIIRVGYDAVAMKFEIPVELERRIDELIQQGLGPSDW